MPEAERAALLAQAATFVKDTTVDFHFEPSGAFTPEFKFEFTTLNAQPLTKDEDPVMMTGNWSGPVPAGSQGYRIVAKPEGKLSVLFLNNLRGKEVSRMMVLFPKEKSFLLDLIGNSHEVPPDTGVITAAASAEGGDAEGVKGQAQAVSSSTSIFGFLRLGFLQVVPRGYEFMLFVLAMFLLGRGFKALAPQVLAFVVAHSLALWMDVMGWVHLTPTIVAWGIASGIVVLAVANVFQSQCTFWRLVLVVVFGLFPGFRLAAAFAALGGEAETASAAGSEPAVQVSALLGFHAGVELGLLAVLAVALLVTAWARSARLFRWAVAVPGSVVLALFGLWGIANRLGWMAA
ncbi:HupE/UreJ family protein [Roseimicrobium sp. ORNL1]|uniref:HupE/UreJ family protein n=1 Tax=Roseimicrobium sp. ORNL1 TaxID=2711231 RepID=UPI0013E0FA1F|nr:HupE/UreJ family protein [Roseimicrobium sp. ORNL1]QIF05273.1 HupE/UreJ family protein [Roseimicrobium sp. ORNL1]